MKKIKVNITELLEFSNEIEFTVPDDYEMDEYFFKAMLTYISSESKTTDEVIQSIAKSFNMEPQRFHMIYKNPHRKQCYAQLKKEGNE